MTSLVLSFLGENRFIKKRVFLGIILLFFICGEFVLKKSIAFRISTVMLYCSERQIMCVAKVFKKLSLFLNFSLYALFQARKTKVAMNLSDFWLKPELPGFFQLAERLHFKELLCLFLRIISFNLCIQKYPGNDETQRNEEVGVKAE